MKAMILAAGLGTRLKPFTNHHPKALAEVNHQTLLQRNIEYLQSFGIKEIVVNVHHFADQIISTIKKNNGFGSQVSISNETENLLDTGGGIFNAKWFFEQEEEPFLVMNVDILTDMDIRNLINQHKKNRPLATLAVSDRNTSRYFLFDEKKKLCGWENIKTAEKKITHPQPNLTRKAFSGIQIMEPSIFQHIQQRGKFSVVDTYLDLAKNFPIEYFDHTGSAFIDAGKPENLLEAEKIFK